MFYIWIERVKKGQQSFLSNICYVQKLNYWNVQVTSQMRSKAQSSLGNQKLRARSFFCLPDHNLKLKKFLFYVLSYQPNFAS